MRSFSPLFFWCACITVEWMSKVVRLAGKRSDRPHLGKRLEAVFRHEAGKLLGIVLRRRLLVPHRPVMHVAIVLIIVIFLEVGAGRAASRSVRGLQVSATTRPATHPTT